MGRVGGCAHARNVPRASTSFFNSPPHSREMLGPGSRWVPGHEPHADDETEVSRKAYMKATYFEGIDVFHLGWVMVALIPQGKGQATDYAWQVASPMSFQ